MIQHLHAAWHHGELDDLALHFAVAMSRLDSTLGDDVLLAAALVSQCSILGEACLNLKDVADSAVLTGINGMAIVAPRLLLWSQILHQSSIVGTGDAYRPLVLENDDRLYLYRYRNLEERVSVEIRRRASEPDVEVDIALLNRAWSFLFPTINESIQQRKAVELIVRR